MATSPRLSSDLSNSVLTNGKQFRPLIKLLFYDQFDMGLHCLHRRVCPNIYNIDGNCNGVEYCVECGMYSYWKKKIILLLFYPYSLYNFDIRRLQIYAHEWSTPAFIGCMEFGLRSCFIKKKNTFDSLHRYI